MENALPERGLITTFALTTKNTLPKYVPPTDPLVAAWDHAGPGTSLTAAGHEMTQRTEHAWGGRCRVIGRR